MPKSKNTSSEVPPMSKEQIQNIKPLQDAIKSEKANLKARGSPLNQACRTIGKLSLLALGISSGFVVAKHFYSNFDQFIGRSRQD